MNFAIIVANNNLLAINKICEKPIINNIIDTFNNIKVDKIISLVDDETKFIENGVSNCELSTLKIDELIKNKGKTVVTNINMPCISEETYSNIYLYLDNYDVVVLDNKLNKIYGINNEVLQDKEFNNFINNLNNEKLKIKYINVNNENEFINITSNLDIYNANKYLQYEINKKHILNGVNILDITNTYISKDVLIQANATIYPNVFISGNSLIKSNAEILSNSRIINSEIGEYSVINSSNIVNSKVNDNCSVGPYSHLRENSVVGNFSRIGNFVELKNTKFGNKSSCAHLTYLGDSEVGNNVNIGCGVISVNYDGKNKHKTIIKDGAFIGCNCNLIAPITIGENSVVAAGSTIDKDVLNGDMAIARSRQENKTGYGLKYKNK